MPTQEFEFPAPPQRTAAEQAAMLRQVIDLSLYFAAAYQARNPCHTLSAVLEKCTPIWAIRSGCHPAKTLCLPK